jgi:aspartate/methionine/tyrosine aminotransferase
MTQISDRVRDVVQSDIRRMSRECERAGGINLGQGICDLPTIPELVEGACDAIASSKATYSKFEGIDLLREKIARKCERFNGFSVDAASQIVVTVYDGRKHVSPASIESCRDVAITISGFSKTFSVTGWRIGYVAAPQRVAGPIGLVNDLFYVCAPTPLQWGIARALDIGDEYYTSLAADYAKKRDLLAEALADAGLKPYVPQGAYYMLAEIPDEARDDKEAAQLLLEETRVASVPGSAFFGGDRGKRLLRFCFAKDFGALDEACRRLRARRTVRTA